MDLRIEKSKLVGSYIVPPSKSYAHRYLIAGLLSGKDFVLHNLDTDSSDIKATLSGLLSLGYDYLKKDNSCYFKKIKDVEEAIINADESGSTLRFFIPLVMALGIKTTIKGTEKLFSRGLDVYLDIFKTFNYHYELTNNSITLFDQLKSGHYVIDATKSSQYITGLLFSLPILNQESIIEMVGKISSEQYLDLSLDVLNKCQIKYQRKDNLLIIKGKQNYQLKEAYIEGDYSNAAFLDVYNYLGGNIELEGLREDSLQGDKRYKTYFKQISQGFCTIDLSNNLDLGPILFTFSCLFKGARFINIRPLRFKESNRVEDLINELQKLDVKIKVFDNEVIIEKTKKRVENPLIVSSHNDHRIAMSLTVILSIYGGIIKNSECVKKSFPTFYQDVVKLGMKVNKLC